MERRDRLDVLARQLTASPVALHRVATGNGTHRIAGLLEERCPPLRPPAAGRRRIWPALVRALEERTGYGPPPAVMAIPLVAPPAGRSSPRGRRLRWRRTGLRWERPVFVAVSGGTYVTSSECTVSVTKGRKQWHGFVSGAV